MGTSSTPTALDRTALRNQLAQLCRPNLGAAPTALPTGITELDTHLPGGGWPVGALTECLLDVHGIGELSLWLPALRAITRDKRYVAFIAPPFVPYAPALRQRGIPLERVIIINMSASDTASDLLWAAEQTLRCTAFGAVLIWPPPQLTDKQLRRLQLAAEAGRNVGVLYRPLSVAQSPSPAALRIKLQAQDRGLNIVIHKCRGGRSGGVVQCAPLLQDARLHAQADATPPPASTRTAHARAI